MTWHEEEKSNNKLLEDSLETLNLQEILWTAMQSRIISSTSEETFYLESELTILGVLRVVKLLSAFRQDHLNGQIPK